MKSRIYDKQGEWKSLKAEGERLIQTAIPAFNQLAKEKGVGVMFVE